MRTLVAIVAVAWLGACAAVDPAAPSEDAPVTFAPPEMEGVKRTHVAFRDRRGDEIWRVMMDSADGFAVVDYRRSAGLVQPELAVAAVRHRLIAEDAGPVRPLDSGQIASTPSPTGWRTFVAGDGRLHCITLARTVAWRSQPYNGFREPAAMIAALLCRRAEPMAGGDPERLSSVLRTRS